MPNSLTSTAPARANDPAISHRRAPPDAYRVASASDTAAKAADGISPVISRAQKKANGDIRIVMQAIAAPSQEPLLSTIVPTARAVITIVLTVSICAALIFWLKSANDDRISSSHSGGWEMKIARYGA